jgi:hypothetical protein
MFRKLNRQKNNEMNVINPLKVVVNQHEILKLLVDKLLEVQINNDLLLLKLKNEELIKKSPISNGNHVKS